jgi:hypothetical protein
MKRKREPEPWEAEWWTQSKPVARSLHILDELDVLVRVSGRTDKTPGFYPFYVEIKRTDLTPGSTEPGGLWENGKPIVLLPGDTFLVTSRRDLHAVAEEALRRSQEAKDEEEP